MANVTAIQPLVIKDACNNSFSTLSQPDYLYTQLWIPLTIASCTATVTMLVFSIGMACYACYMKRQLVDSRRLALDECLSPQELDAKLLRLGPVINRNEVTLIDVNPLPVYKIGGHMQQQQLAGSSGSHASSTGQVKPPRSQPFASLPVVTAEHELSRSTVSVVEPFTPGPQLLGAGGLIAEPERPVGKCTPNPAADRKQQEQPPQLPQRLGKDKDSAGGQVPSETRRGGIGSPVRILTESCRPSGDDSFSQIVLDLWPKSSAPAKPTSNFGLPSANPRRAPPPKELLALGRLSGNELERSGASYIAALAWPDGDDYDYTEAVPEMRMAKSRQQQQQQSGSSLFTHGKSPAGSPAPSEALPARGNSPARSMAGSSVSSDVATSIEGRISNGARFGVGGLSSSGGGGGSGSDVKIALGSRQYSAVPPERAPSPELPFAARTRAMPFKAPPVLRRQLSDSQLDWRVRATRSYVIVLPSPEADDYDYVEALVDMQKKMSRLRSLTVLRPSETCDYYDYDYVEALVDVQKALSRLRSVNALRPSETYDYDYCRAHEAPPLLLCPRGDRLPLHAPPPRSRSNAAAGIDRCG